jgi:hypothetical protein
LSAGKRIQQGIRALLAVTQSVDYELAGRYLNAKQMTLFCRMTKSEQLHSLHVLEDVLADGEAVSDELAVAALMHDVGKARYHLAIWQKTIAVLARKLFPKMEAQLAQGEHLNFWRAPFVVRKYHPKWSGELLAEVGASEQAIWLVTHHADPATKWQTHPSYLLLFRLQKADDAN